MDNVTIRNATGDDVEGIYNLRKGRYLSEEIIQDRLEEQKNGVVDYYVILNDENQIIGQILLNWAGKPTHPEYPDLVDLYISKQERGKGYGKALVKFCEEKVREKSHNKIGLAVNPDPSCVANIMYTNLGYIADGNDKYVDGIYDGVEDWVIDMEKNL